MSMNAAEFERIREKIKNLEVKRSKAEGAIENEQANWKKTYKVSTREEMGALLESAEEEVDILEGKMDTLYTELKGLTNWGLLP